MKKLDTIQSNKGPEPKTMRASSIDDISLSGHELPEEQLNLVVGGLRSLASMRLCQPDMCTPNCDVGYC